MDNLQAILPLDSDKKDVKEAQSKRLKLLLKHAWNNSTFYRDLWSSSGLDQQHLEELTINDLPIINKKMIVENFDKVVTNPRLKYKAIHELLETSAGTTPVLFDNSYLIIRSSGSSRLLGAFVYDLNALSLVKKSIRSRMYPALSCRLNRKMRYAYLGVINGNYAGETLARGTPDDLYEKLLLSVLSDESEVLDKLINFRPDVIGGYASSISMIAKAQLQNKLSITPFHINCGGDYLSNRASSLITRAWQCSLYNIYACSESLAGLAVNYGDNQNFIVFDDIVLLELLDSQGGSVITGKPGQVAITNLYNMAMPIIRYQLDDLAIKGSDVYGFSSIEKICGRSYQNLPVVNNDGQVSEIHALHLDTFWVDSMEAIQFVSHSPGSISIKYQANENIASKIEDKFHLLLKEKKANKNVRFSVEMVDLISIDKVSGKRQLVVSKHA